MVSRPRPGGPARPPAVQPQPIYGPGGQGAQPRPVGPPPPRPGGPVGGPPIRHM